MNVVFLYTELAGYFLACANKLAEDERYNVHIIRWPVNNEAPFDFIFSARLKIYNRSDMNAAGLTTLVRSLRPDFIYCSGWIDKDYLRICRSYRKQIPIVVGFDNHWYGSFKQKLASLLAPFTLKQIFNYCWVPGAPQVKYARKIGFKDDQILKGFYSADVDAFSEMYVSHRPLKESNFPHRFVYSGRYVPYKWITELCEIFLEAKKELDSDWELWCLGIGPEKPVQDQHIRHLGFIQPDQLSEILQQTGVFVLPSTSEPWGVVVHEYAAAGFPLICSTAVGAASAFLEEGRNGYAFSSGDRAGLKEVLKKIMQTRDAELLKMGEKSHNLAASITPEKWANEIKRLTGSFEHVRN